MKVKFIDSGRYPKCEPDPDYPDGRDIDISKGGPSCKVDLPYPAPRCGLMEVTCEECRSIFFFTVAGRPDDPKTVRVPCRNKVH